MISILPAALLALPLAGQEPATVPSTIVEVTVYPGTAAVRRRASLPSGSGRFVLEGLPHGLDPNALRVRAEGAEVVGVELRERVRAAAPDERVAELRARVMGLERELSVVEDERGVLRRVQEHLDRLLVPEASAAPEVTPAPDQAAWQANLEYLSAKLAEVRAKDRGLQAGARDLRRRIDDARLELGRVDADGGVRVRDLYVDVYGPEAPAALEVDYLVADAGWTPTYDLRAAKDLSGVELAYRARVRQRTGEDWRDVVLLLSTAEPRRGAQGPEPQERWVGLYDPRPRRGFAVGADAGPATPAPEEKSIAMRALGYAGEPVDAEDTFAVAQAEGLSVRFRLAARETVESREQPSTVLVGRAPLAIAPEHYCVPALDPTVWLRAKARNTSDWVLLPGRAAVYFGADFLGHADLPAVQRDEELVLPLGPDPGLGVERVVLENLNEEPGFFGSKRTGREAWRLHLKNNGAFTTRADGSIDVIVHEALPKPTDDRIEVEIDEVRPAVSKAARWNELLQEQSILTWVVRVPKGGGTTIEMHTSISYPEDEVLQRR